MISPLGFQSPGGFPHPCVVLPACNGILRFTSGVTPADLSTASMAAGAFLIHMPVANNDRCYCLLFVDIDQIRAEMSLLSQRTSSLVDDVSPLKDKTRQHTEDINTARDDVSQLKGSYNMKYNTATSFERENSNST